MNNNIYVSDKASDHKGGIIMNVYASIRKGRRKGKKQCEDRIVVGTEVLADGEKSWMGISPSVIGVADGVGGAAGGAEAAAFICHNIGKADRTDLASSLDVLNADLIAHGGECGCFGMATTFSGVLLNGEKTIVHVGNTRISTIKGNTLEPLTSDHTTYWRLMLEERYEEAMYCNPNEIYHCFGGYDDSLFVPDIFAVPEMHKIILTSDGIHDHMEYDDLERLLCSDLPYPELCEKLMEEAAANGSHDDMSIIIAELTE